MKKVCVLLLAMLLVLSGCAKQVKAKDISVKDGSFPYEIDHKKGAAEITLQDAAKNGVLWRVEAFPQGICTVSEEKADEEYTCRYGIAGIVEGAAKLTFTALQEDEAEKFTLNFFVNVDANGKVIISDVSHQEIVDVSVSEDDWKYKWNVDVSGTLHFSFANSEDRWSIQGDGEKVCNLLDVMETPSGCEFSAQAGEPGQTTIKLIGENTQRQIRIVLSVDDAGKLEVVSVQE